MADHHGSAPASSPKRPQAHSRNQSLNTSFTLGPEALPQGPPIRPLDFRALISSHEGTHAELARIVDDLAQWLSVAETGLTRLLENSTAEDRIEEESEDTVTNPYFVQDYDDQSGEEASAFTQTANV